MASPYIKKQFNAELDSRLSCVAHHFVAFDCDAQALIETFAETSNIALRGWYHLDELRSEVVPVVENVASFLTGGQSEMIFEQGENAFLRGMR